MATTDKTLVATEPLFIGRARAHNVGDLVPADNVERNGWTDGVASPTSQKGRAALGLPAEATAAEAKAAAEASTAARP